MTFDEYQAQARLTANPDVEDEMVLLEGVLGLVGESGEVADEVKKAWFQGHELNQTEIVKELGDILWYVSRSCDALGITMAVVAKRNNERLKARYPNGFESKRSINRAD